MNKIAPHPSTWFARNASLLESRRFGEAAAFAADARTMPEEFPDSIGRRYADLATALVEDDNARISDSLSYVKSNLGDVGYIPRAVPLLALLGDPETALTAYWAYLFGALVAGHDHAAPGTLLRNRIQRRTFRFGISAFGDQHLPVNGMHGHDTAPCIEYSTRVRIV